MKRLALLLASLAAASLAHAHLMPAQRGTLNVASGGAFLVLSVPVSALHGVDDDGDGALSGMEAHAHRAEIERQVRAGVHLSGDGGEAALEGLMLSLSPPEEGPAAPARDVVVLGRFDGSDRSRIQQLDIRLFGTTEAQRQYDVTVTRGRQAQLAHFSPARTRHRLFPSAMATVADAAQFGALHVLGGWDHLLFLLVVLLAGGSWRSIAFTLSVFMAGHAITVALAGLGFVRIPASIVEPTIAATIIVLAVFDHVLSRRTGVPEKARLALVFACALIHGLGLASGFLDLGVDLRHRVLALAGFNFGIEATQLAIAALVLAGVNCLRPGSQRRFDRGVFTAVLPAPPGH